MNYCINCKYFIAKKEKPVKRFSLALTTGIIEYDRCGFYLDRVTMKPQRCVDVRPLVETMELVKCNAYKELELKNYEE